MLRRASPFAVLTVLLFCGAAPVSKPTGDWPAWRGPDRNDISRETGLLQEWPDEGPKLLWKATGLGEGFTTPSFEGGRIYSMGNANGQECVMALDRKDGKQLWLTVLGEVRHQGGGYPGPRSTPTVDGNHIYVLGLAGDLACLAADSGNIIWRHDLVKDFGGAPGGWGYTESVLIDGPWALCTPGGANSTVIALNKTDGTPVWSAKVGDQAGYSSLMKATIQNQKQYIQFTGKGVISVSAKDGAPLWRYDAPANGTANISTPIVSGDKVFAASGYGKGAGEVKIERKGTELAAEEVFFTTEMMNHHGGLVLLNGYIYGSSDPGVLRCIDFSTGKTKWSDRTCGKGSLTYADGRLYVRAEKGTVSLVEATPDEFRLKGRFEQPDRSQREAWPHPVVAGGKLYLRDQDALFCYDVKAK